MFRGCVYFAGAKSRWQGRVHPDEIIFEFSAPWFWAVRWVTTNTFNRLDASRCGYVLLDDDEVIEQYDPPLAETRVAA